MYKKRSQTKRLKLCGHVLKRGRGTQREKSVAEKKGERESERERGGGWREREGRREGDREKEIEGGREGEREGERERERELKNEQQIVGEQGKIRRTMHQCPYPSPPLQPNHPFTQAFWYIQMYIESPTH